MSRPLVNREKKTEKISAKVPPSLKDEIAAAMEKEDRTESYIAYVFMMRGLAAYKRDGLLFEPQDNNHTEAPHGKPETIRVRLRQGGRSSSQKRKSGT